MLSGEYRIEGSAGTQSPGTGASLEIPRNRLGAEAITDLREPAEGPTTPAAHPPLGDDQALKPHVREWIKCGQEPGIDRAKSLWPLDSGSPCRHDGCASFRGLFDERARREVHWGETSDESRAAIEPTPDPVNPVTSGARGT